MKVKARVGKLSNFNAMNIPCSSLEFSELRDGKEITLNDKVADLQGRIDSGELEGEELAQAERDLRSAENQLDRIVELDPLTEQWISSDEGDR